MRTGVVQAMKSTVVRSRAATKRDWCTVAFKPSGVLPSGTTISGTTPGASCSPSSTAALTCDAHPPVASTAACNDRRGSVPPGAMSYTLGAMRLHRPATARSEICRGEYPSRRSWVREASPCWRAARRWRSNSLAIVALCRRPLTVRCRTTGNAFVARLTFDWPNAAVRRGLPDFAPRRSLRRQTSGEEPRGDSLRRGQDRRGELARSRGCCAAHCVVGAFGTRGRRRAR